MLGAEFQQERNVGRSNNRPVLRAFNSVHILINNAGINLRKQ
jgi:hypothetical protein